MTSLKVVPFPEHFAAMNIPEALRTLAIEIEDGRHGECHSLLWVIDMGCGDINLGLLGKVPDLTGTALLLSLAVQKKVMGGIAE